MTLNSFTLDIEPSSPGSNMDDTEDEDSVNQIVEFSDSNDVEDTVDATNFIIPTQNCIVIPSTPVISESDPIAASIPPVPDPIDLTTDLQAIAIKIKKREESCALTEAERKIIDGSTRHEKGYGASICRIEKRFFDTIDEFGTDGLKRLLVLEDDGLKCERLFYIKLRGERTQAKQVILNECLIYCAIKWTCLTGKRKGQVMESSSFEQNMRVLFRTFAQHGLQYDFRKHFNDNGEFHGAIMATWDIQK